MELIKATKKRTVVVANAEEINIVIRCLDMMIDNYLSYCHQRFLKQQKLDNNIEFYVNQIALLINFINRLRPQDMRYYQEKNHWDEWGSSIQSALADIQMKQLKSE